MVLSLVLSVTLAGAAPTATERANAWLLGNIAAFREYADHWKRDLDADSGALDPARLKAELDTLRRSYKRLEAAAETLHPECLEAFNGPPFEIVEDEEPSEIEIETPQGLQVLEQEVYGDAPRRSAIRLSLSQLVFTADQLTGMLRYTPADDSLFWEAAENEVIRVLALGLSGFDSPASGHGLSESGVALRSLRAFPGFYRARLDARRPGAFATLDRRLDAAARALESARDFDAFDRLDFIRRLGNPLHAAMADARAALRLGRGAPLLGDSRARRLRPIPERAIHPDARGLFDPAFLDKDFFALDYDGKLRAKPSPAAEKLGRQLFFEPLLSGDNKRACASCHRPEFAYAEPLLKSAGFRPTGDTAVPSGERNAPSLVYAGYQRAQFWDMRAPILEEQVGHVVRGRAEFNTTFAAIAAKLQTLPSYVTAFSQAFPKAGADAITEATMTAALAQYVRSLAGWNSPFDRYVRGEKANLDASAKNGFNLFMGKSGCGTCHFPPSFNGTVPPLYRETESEVLGVPAGKDTDTGNRRLDPDSGRYHVRPAQSWLGAFKTPTVRNIALTAPYMHNGHFRDLEGVVDFYDAGGGAGLGLKVPNQTLPADSLHLTPSEKSDLIAFMRALTDNPLRIDRPDPLPQAQGKPEWAARKPGGEY
ncbi:MAG: cytochrome c peroxidase [Fibrobacteria bacterium]